MTKVLVGMSGGVDSSVAAMLLKEQGYLVTGCTLLLRSGDGCGADNDSLDAKKVCNVLGIPHITLDMKKEFEENVINRFISDYTNGRTPNPCIECNRYIKFGFMLKYAMANGFDFVATGHYAKITESNGVYSLRSVDNKDQSYFLCRLNQEQLKHTLFPLSSFSKDEIRLLAKNAKLPVHAKRDSQDVCFIPNGSIADFLTAKGHRLKPGDITDKNGIIMGKHIGAAAYTIGQRKGLGGGFPSPMFVLSTDIKSNTVVIGQNDDLFSANVIGEDVSYIGDTPPVGSFSADVKLRFGAKKAPAVLFPDNNGNIKIVFDEPQRAPTPGQSAVFYDGDEVIGAAVIKTTKEVSE